MDVKKPDAYQILTVDDEPYVHQMLEKIINDSGLPVVLRATAISGFEAVTIAQEIRPDICILDIEMGEMNGLELAQQLKAALDYDPYIIYVTAYSRFEYAQQAIRVGAADYFLKPISPEDVISALKKAVNEIQARRVKAIEDELLKKQLQRLAPGITAAVDPVKESHRASIVRDAINYIKEHYQEDLSLNKVAEVLSLSPGYLGSIFNKEVGVSFRGYLRSVRIARAKELLHDRKLNLSEIARMVGYDNVNYFSQAFLVETGIRPGEYRGGGRRWAK